MLLVAILGGYQNCKHDPPPGHQLMWRGYERMSLATAEFRTDSRSEQLLLDAMQIGHLRPHAKLNVEGYELDFALMERRNRLDIEVDGDQHLDARGRRRRQDITRDRVLLNLGGTVLRIPAWRCYEEIDSVIDEIRETRDRLLDATPCETRQR